MVWGTLNKLQNAIHLYINKKGKLDRQEADITMEKDMKNKGFSLVEMVVVIVLLGILAVTAAPRFLNLQDDARDAVLKGYAGALKGSLGIVSGKWMVEGEPSTLTIDGTELSFVNEEGKFNFPVAADTNDCVNIWNALVDGVRSVETDAGKDELLTKYLGMSAQVEEVMGATCQYALLNAGSILYVSGTGEVSVN